MPVGAHDLYRHNIIAPYIAAECLYKQEQHCNYTTNNMQSVQTDNNVQK